MKILHIHQKRINGFLMRTDLTTFERKIISHEPISLLYTNNDRIWAVANETQIIRIDPVTCEMNQIMDIRTPRGTACKGIYDDGEYVWILGTDLYTTLIKATLSGEVVKEVHFTQPYYNIVATKSHIWLTGEYAGPVLKINKHTCKVENEDHVPYAGSLTTTLYADERFVWVFAAKKFSKIDSETNEVCQTSISTAKATYIYTALFDPDRNCFWVLYEDRFLKVDYTTLEVVEVYKVPRTSYYSSIAQDKDNLYLSGSRNEKMIVINKDNFESFNHLHEPVSYVLYSNGYLWGGSDTNSVYLQIFAQDGDNYYMLEAINNDVYEDIVSCTYDTNKREVELGYGTSGLEDVGTLKLPCISHTLSKGDVVASLL